MKEGKEVFFRFTCFQTYFKKIFKAIRNVKAKDCCRYNCDHQCLKWQGECSMPTSDCVHLPCSNCGASIEQCRSNFFKAYSIYNFVCETSVTECVRFTKGEKPLVNFPHCKTLSQIFDGFIHNAVDVCSSYLLKIDEIDDDTHKDNLMYLRLIHKLPIQALDVLFEEEKHRCEK